VGAGLLLLGIALVGISGSVAWDHLDDRSTAASPAPATQAAAPAAGGEYASVSVDALGQHLPVAVGLPDAPALSAVGTPRVDTPALAVPVHVDVQVARDGGAAAEAGSGAATQVASASQRLVVPPAATVALGAAAFAGAGLLVYFWTSVKAWAGRALLAPAVGLYAKITRAEVFDNAVRERIFAAIRATPGISASDLAKLADVSWGTTIYHLDVLEQNRMVTSLRRGRHRRYFENGAELGASKDAFAVLANPVTAGVADTIRHAPGATQKELASATGMSPQALHWHLARLVEVGVVRKERAGRFVKHYAAAA
jgi:DNA-binding transcriptional ArsR family regulator